MPVLKRAVSQENLSKGFPTRSNTTWDVQSQMVSDLKFRK